MSLALPDPPRFTVHQGGRCHGIVPKRCPSSAAQEAAAPSPTVVPLAPSLRQEQAQPQEPEVGWLSSLASALMFCVGLGLWAGVIAWVSSRFIQLL